MQLSILRVSLVWKEKGKEKGKEKMRNPLLGISGWMDGRTKGWMDSIKVLPVLLWMSR